MQSFENFNPKTDKNEVKNGLDRWGERSKRVVDLSMKLCKHETISVPKNKARIEEMHDCADVVREFCDDHDLNVIELPVDEEHPSPVMIVTFKEGDEAVLKSDLALMGHLDVVAAQDQEQFEPKIDGDWLVGRGSADMKTVVASQLVWMAEQQALEGEKPPFVTMISFTEENGDRNKNGMMDAINYMRDELDMEIGLGVVGERTTEVNPNDNANRDKINTICDANRAVHHLKAEAGKKLTGIEAIKVFADVMKSGREISQRNNEIISSDRMERQNSWRTSFSNPFLQIAANDDFTLKKDSKILSLERKGPSKHTAEVEVKDPSTAEVFMDIIESAREKFGENVQLYDLLIGEENAFNTVSAEGKMNLIVDAGRQEIAEWIEAVVMENEKLGDKSYIEASEGDWDLSLGLESSLFGLDIREIPEHMVEIADLIEDLREKMRESGGDLHSVIEANGWICPPDNSHLQKIAKASERYHGVKPIMEGKPHANDGRLVPGGRAVVLGQSGHNPHGPEEAHYIPSVRPWMELMDEVAKEYAD